MIESVTLLVPLAERLVVVYERQQAWELWQKQLFTYSVGLPFLILAVVSTAVLLMILYRAAKDLK